MHRAGATCKARERGGTNATALKTSGKAFPVPAAGPGGQEEGVNLQPHSWPARCEQPVLCRDLWLFGHYPTTLKSLLQPATPTKTTTAAAGTHVLVVQLLLVHVGSQQLLLELQHCSVLLDQPLLQSVLGRGELCRRGRELSALLPVPDPQVMSLPAFWPAAQRDFCACRSEERWLCWMHSVPCSSCSSHASRGHREAKISSGHKEP